MLTVILIRHGETDAVGRRLSGRTEGVPLNARGHEQAERLADALARVRLTGIIVSPLQRALETATPLAIAHGTAMRIDRALIDVDFGEWTGMLLDDVRHDPRWSAFNAHRERAIAPGGESLRDVSDRMDAALESIRQQFLGGVVAVVTHAEPIRCAVARARSVTLDQALAIEIDTGSVSILDAQPGRTWRDRLVNATPDRAGGALDGGTT